jgi:hypothetical protein
MALDHTSDDFDWVAAQSDCTADAMFRELVAGLRKDVERRNLTGPNDGLKFEIHEAEEGIEVARVESSGFGPTRTLAFVAFTREGKRIHIQGDGVNVDFSVLVTVNHAGECRFFVGEAEYSNWHIRRMALEELFFEEISE